MFKNSLRFKVLLTGFLLATLFTVTVGAKTVDAAALTSSQIQAIIGLLQAFGADQNVIQNVNSVLTVGSSGGTSVGGSTTTTSPVCYTFAKDLTVGSRDSTTNSEVSKLQEFLSSEGFSVSNTGYFGSVTQNALANWQASNGVVSTGYFGPLTRERLIIECPALPSITILSPNGGETYKNNGSYITVNWQTNNVPRDFKFDVVRLRSYPNGGEYNLASGVLNDGQEVIVIPSSVPIGAYTLEIKSYLNGVLVFDSSDSYFKIVDSNTQSSISVLSPNGGESWQKNTTQYIKWQDSVGGWTCPAGASCIPPAPYPYDIMLAPYYPPCTTSVCPESAYYRPYTIAKGVAGPSYAWIVGQVVDLRGNNLESSITDGAYTVQVCRSGTGTCDSSNSYFKIYSQTSDNKPPVVNGVSGPTTLNVGQTGTWTVKAYDPENGPLSYSVVWGDEVTTGSGTSQAPVSSSVTQNTTFTHSYANTGIYNPTFTVIDNQGQSAQTSVSVNVGGISQSSLTVLSPNGGETWQKGTQQTIKWQDNTTYPPCVVGAPCVIPPLKFYDIKLAPYYPPCTTNVCPASAYLYISPYTIAKNVAGFSYSWTVGRIVLADDLLSLAPDGSYTVQICQVGTNICDSSNSYFKILSSTIAPVIYNFTPTSGLVGTRINVNGSGFLPTGNSVVFGTGLIRDYTSSSDGANISFVLPASMPYYCAPGMTCYADTFNVVPGIYKLTVVNANGYAVSQEFFTVL